MVFKGIIYKTGMWEDVKIGDKIIRTNFWYQKRIIRMLNANFSPILLIVGNQRVGKSFLGCFLAAWIMEKCFQKTFAVKKNCIYNLEQAIEKIDRSTEEVVILDEMIELGYRREHYLKSHFQFTKIINSQGYKKLVYIFILPFASDLDRSFVKHVDIMFFCKKRGLCIASRIKKQHTDFNPQNTKFNFSDKFTIGLKNAPPQWDEYVKYSNEMKQNINEKINREIKGEIAKTGTPLAEFDITHIR